MQHTRSEGQAFACKAVRVMRIARQLQSVAAQAVVSRVEISSADNL
ncbi:hypothetical protein B566_EDAN000739 [Ephemera danica]|nr:hypothetical protein B566_EDAN000739 [Ephemera danica]